MSDFCKLGNALIDFDQVRMVEPLDAKTIKVHYIDGSNHAFRDDNSIETITAAFDGALERYKERQANGGAK